MKNYNLLILNDNLHSDWSNFINSSEVNRLSNLSTIELSNFYFNKLLDKWIMKTAKKFCPPDGDILEVKKVIENFYGGS